MKILLNLTRGVIPFVGTYKDEWGFLRHFDSFKIASTSGKRAYLTTIKDGMGLSEIIKKMEFEAGEVFVSFGKDAVVLGTYSTR